MRSTGWSTCCVGIDLPAFLIVASACDHAMPWFPRSLRSLAFRACSCVWLRVLPGWSGDVRPHCRHSSKRTLTRGQMFRSTSVWSFVDCTCRLSAPSMIREESHDSPSPSLLPHPAPRLPSSSPAIPSPPGSIREALHRPNPSTKPDASDSSSLLHGTRSRALP